MAFTLSVTILDFASSLQVIFSIGCSSATIYSTISSTGGMDLVWIGIALFVIGAAWFVFAPGATKPASRNKKSKKKKEPSSQKKPHRHTARKQQGAEEDFSDELEEEFPAEVEAGFPAGFEAVSEESLKHHPNSAISSHLSSSTAMSSNTVSAKTVSANPPSGVGNESEPVSEPTMHSAANLGAENERVLPNDTMMDEPVFKEPETGGPMLDEPMLDEQWWTNLFIMYQCQVNARTTNHSLTYDSLTWNSLSETTYGLLRSLSSREHSWRCFSRPILKMRARGTNQIIENMKNLSIRLPL